MQMYGWKRLMLIYKGPDEANERQDPYSVEQRILGSMLINPSCVGTVLEQLEPEEFNCVWHREIFLGISALHSMGRPVDCLTLCDCLAQINSLVANECDDYLIHLVNTTVTSANISEDIWNLKAARREQMEKIHRIQELRDELRRLTGSDEGL